MQPEEDLNWTDQPVIGLVLMGAEKDSNGLPIDPMKYYNVAKVRFTGMLVIVATERNMKHEFMNDQLKKSGKFN